MALTSSFIPMESAAQLLSIIMLLTEVNLVSSKTKTDIYCFPLPLAASLSCETGHILVTQAHVGNVEERAQGFCANPRNGPEHNKYDVGNMTNMMRKYCNTFRQCGLDTMRGLSLPRTRYLFVEYWCTETDLPNSAYMNLFGDRTAFGKEIIIQTMGYPSSEIAATDNSCDITSTESIPSIRMDIYDFSSNSSEGSSYCLEWNGELRKCAEKGGLIGTFISEGGKLIMKKMTGEPLTIRLMMTLTAIDTADGKGDRSPNPFNITCQPINGDRWPAFPQMSNKSNGKLPIIVGAVLGSIFVIAVAIGAFLLLRKMRKEDPLKTYSNNFQYNVNTARRLGAKDATRDDGEGIYDELDDVKNVYSNDAIMDYRVSQISPYVTSTNGIPKEPVSVVTKKGIFSVSNGLKGKPKEIPPYSVVDKKQQKDLSALYSMPVKNVQLKPKPPIAVKPKTQTLTKQDSRLSDASYSLDIVDNVIYKV